MAEDVVWFVFMVWGLLFSGDIGVIVIFMIDVGWLLWGLYVLLIEIGDIEEMVFFYLIYDLEVVIIDFYINGVVGVIYED